MHVPPPALGRPCRLRDAQVEGKDSLMLLRQRHGAHHQALDGPGDQVQQKVEEPAAHDALQTHLKPSLAALLLIIGTFAVTVRVCCGRAEGVWQSCSVWQCTGRLHASLPNKKVCSVAVGTIFVILD